jgi:hypothetical protein
MYNSNEIWSEFLLLTALLSIIPFQGERIAVSAYACEWYNEPVSFQRSVGLVMMRAQRPVVLTLGPFGTVSLELFAAVSRRLYQLPS